MLLKTYYIKTFGCQMNFSDSERLATFFESQGFENAEEINMANVVIFNTCGVRQTAEDRVYGQVHNLRKWSIKHEKNCKIIVTGCLAHRKDFQERLKSKVDLFSRIKDIKKIENWIIENSLKIVNCELKILKQGEKSTKKNKQGDYFSIKPKYKKNGSALVPIMTGCNNFCSYCVVPYARGREKSRTVENIFKEIEGLSKNGCKEITLLGQNVNSYSHKIKNQPCLPAGRKSKIKTAIKNSKLDSQKIIENLDLKIDCKLKIENWKFKRQPEIITFPLLLGALAKTYPEIKWRFLTSHPKDFSEELMHVVAGNENISKEIHLPFQSGSDKILKAMNRPYTQKHYLNLIEKAQKIIPKVTFTTDVIVGFPGETEKDFQETVKVFERVKYTEAYINKYSPRPETAAEKLGDPIAWDEKKRREKYLRELIKKNKKS